MTSAVPAPAPENSAAEVELQRKLCRFLPGFYFLSFAALGCIVPYLALRLGERGVGTLVLMGTLGAIPLGRLLAGPGWSIIADRWQAPGAVLRGAALLPVLGGAALIWGPVETLVVASFFFAIGRAPMGPLVDGLALRAVAGDRGAYGRLRVWGSAGFLVATFVSAALRDAIGLDPLVLGLVMCALLAVVVHGLPRVDATVRTDIGPALKALALDPVILGLCVASALHFSVHVATTSFLAVHFVGLGEATTWAGTALAAGVAVEIGLMSAAPWLLRRFGPRTLFLASLVLAVPRWLGMAMTADPVLLVLLQGVHGFTFGVFWLAGVSLFASRAPPEVAHSAQALFAAAVGGVGALLGMVGGAILAEELGTRAIFQVGVGVALAASLIGVLALRGTRR